VTKQRAAEGISNLQCKPKIAALMQANSVYLEEGGPQLSLIILYGLLTLKQFKSK
jgi:hypothetical protein